MNPRRSCPVCESVHAKVLHRQSFMLPEGHPLGEGYDVVCCDRCGFVYADTTVGQEEYDRFYRQWSKYADPLTSTGAGESEWDRKRLQDSARFLAEAMPGPETRILDLGCAGGGLLKALSEVGFRDLHGVDPSPECVAQTRQIDGVRADAGSIFSLPSGLGRFGGVILSHVLEHVQDLRRAAGILSDLLLEGGFLYVEVPDASAYHRYLVAPFQDFNTEHINHFSLTTMARLFSQFGLRPVREGAKAFKSTGGFEYPAIYAVYVKAPLEAAPAPQVRDVDLGRSICEYIRLSREMMSAMDARIGGLLNRAPEIIVWGTGQLVMKLLRETALAQADIAFFVDGNPVNHGKMLRGRPIRSPAEVGGSNLPILVATTLSQREIVTTIRNDLRLPNEVVTLGEP
jgi:SAM-dependent methyltransferase